MRVCECERACVCEPDLVDREGEQHVLQPNIQMHRREQRRTPHLERKSRKERFIDLFWRCP